MPRQKKQHLKRRADGRYCCRYNSLFFYGNTEEEALAAREEYKRELRLREPQMPLLSEYSVRWLAAYKSHLTEAPYNTHVRMINRFIALNGNRRVGGYAPTDVSAFYQQFAGKSASTIHSARDTIKAVFAAAVADGLIASSPAQSVKLPKGTKGTHRAITEEERALIHAVQHRLRPAVLVMLYAGLRRGEVMALDVDRDIDFERRTLTVREAVRFDASGQPMICRPKTDAGVRTVPLLDTLANELRGLHGLLCPKAGGGLMTESAWARAWDSYLYALGEAANGTSRRWSKGAWVPVGIRPHDLRHSYCTMLYNAGVDLKTAMLWMGHADQTMTMQIYTHLTNARRTEAENALRNAEKTAFGSQKGSQFKIE